MGSGTKFQLKTGTNAKKGMDKAMRRLQGVRVPHLKSTAGSAPVYMTDLDIAIYPMVQHIGAPAEVVRQKGDTVCVGTLLAKSSGAVSSPIYSGVSGTVEKIEEVLLSNGKYVPAIFIKPDGGMTPDPTLAPPKVSDTQSFVQAVRDSGVVGLGGAGFPTGVKLDIQDLSQIQEIIINGAECEPYITSDTRTMLDRSQDMLEGIRLLQKYLEAKKIVIGVEKNKPQCIRAMKQIAGSDGAVVVKELPSIYPQGAEKVLIYHTTGKVVPEGGLPVDAGVIVLNCTTLAAIARYIRTGMPLVEKCITVDGSAVKTPQNVIVPIGATLRAVFDFCGGFKSQPGKILYGGPMMGISVPDLDMPVLKQTNALLALDARDAAPKDATNCIRCGRCTNICPIGLAPVSIATAYGSGDMEGLQRIHANLCMECGCCSYVCPAKRPLVQQNKLAKAALAAWQKSKK